MSGAACGSAVCPRGPRIARYAAILTRDAACEETKLTLIKAKLGGLIRAQFRGHFAALFCSRGLFFSQLVELSLALPRPAIVPNISNIHNEEDPCGTRA